MCLDTTGSMNFKRVTQIIGKPVKIMDNKTLDERIPGGRLLFLTGDKFPVIQFEAPKHRHEKVTTDKDGTLIGDEWLLNKAIAVNGDVKFLATNDSLVSAMESIYWTLVDKFKETDAVELARNVDIIYRLKDAVKNAFPELDASSDLEDVAIALESHKISSAKAVNMVTQILISSDIFNVVGIRSYWNDLIR